MKHQISDNLLLKESISHLTGPENFRNLKDQLLKWGTDALIKAEMNHHLSYHIVNKPIDVNICKGYSLKTIKTTSGYKFSSVRKDMKAQFDPVNLPKHMTTTKELEEYILLHYAKGKSKHKFMHQLSQNEIS